jgi:hypothetical protein
MEWLILLYHPRTTLKSLQKFIFITEFDQAIPHTITHFL